MECGVSSIIFGFLYGSLFGLEHIVPPLWFNPLRNISYIVTVCVIYHFKPVHIQHHYAVFIIRSLRLRHELVNELF